MFCFRLKASIIRMPVHVYVLCGVVLTERNSVCCVDNKERCMHVYKGVLVRELE